MSNIIIFHGSDKIVEKPSFNYEYSSSHNDYGKGFYCTKNLDMAKEWANRRTDSGFANKYSFDERGLKILDLTDKDKYSVLNWIAILLHNRELKSDDKIEYKDELEYLEKKYYIDTNLFDVIIGFRADDAYFRFPLMFLKNQLTIDRLNEIYLNGKLGKQYVLVSKKAFEKIKFVKYIVSKPIYKERYILRKDNADNYYRKLEREEKMSKGKRLLNLMRENND